MNDKPESSQKDKTIAWFSCGATSAISCLLAINKYGRENCRIIYIHIDSHSPDNKRFIGDFESKFNCKIETIQSHRYKSQFEVIEKTGFINSPYGARCTTELKKKVRQKIEKEGFKRQIFGFEFDKKQIDRANRFREQYPLTRPVFPLIKSKLGKKECINILASKGVKPPELYYQGFPNNNCIGCVKGGMGYWNLVRKKHPDTFRRMSELERRVGHSCIKGVYLDELSPDRGRHKPIKMPDCSIHCEIEFLGG